MEGPQYEASRRCLEALADAGLLGPGRAIAQSLWSMHALGVARPGQPHTRWAPELHLFMARGADPLEVEKAYQMAKAWDFGRGQRPVKVTLELPMREPTEVRGL